MQIPSSRYLSFAGALILFSMALSGCNSATSDTSAPAAKADETATSTSGENAPSAAADQVQPAAAKDSRSPSSKKESSIPPPIEVGHRVKPTVLPDGKLFQETTYKLFSDDSIVM